MGGTVDPRASAAGDRHQSMNEKRRIIINDDPELT